MSKINRQRFDGNQPSFNETHLATAHRNSAKNILTKPYK